jgi:cyclopropane fatty-acyl-phospholipid synthase-like methyltransferase
MNQDDHKRIVDFYESSFSLYGDDSRSVQWSNERTQNIRFEVLNGIADLNHKQVLDVGCGLADLYKFFLKKQIDVDYTGIDIVPAFIERAKVRFPDAHLILSNIESFKDTYDYILASGTFNVTVENASSYYFEMIRNLFECARKGFAFTMLDIQSHVSDDIYIAYDKNEVLTFCKTLTPYVVVKDEYLPWDFTIYMYKK